MKRSEVVDYINNYSNLTKTERVELGMILDNWLKNNVQPKSIILSKYSKIKNLIPTGYILREIGYSPETLSELTFEKDYIKMIMKLKEYFNNAEIWKNGEDDIKGKVRKICFELVNMQTTSKINMQLFLEASSKFLREFSNISYARAALSDILFRILLPYKVKGYEIYKSNRRDGKYYYEVIYDEKVQYLSILLKWLNNLFVEYNPHNISNYIQNLAIGILLFGDELQVSTKILIPIFSAWSNFEKMVEEKVNKLRGEDLIELLNRIKSEYRFDELIEREFENIGTNVKSTNNIQNWLNQDGIAVIEPNWFDNFNIIKSFSDVNLLIGLILSDTYSAENIASEYCTSLDGDFHEITYVITEQQLMFLLNDVIRKKDKEKDESDFNIGTYYSNEKKCLYHILFEKCQNGKSNIYLIFRSKDSKNNNIYGIEITYDSEKCIIVFDVPDDKQYTYEFTSNMKVDC